MWESVKLLHLVTSNKENLELWLYMTELSSEPNFNLLTGVLIYDKQDGVVVNGTTVTESGNRLSYTIYDIPIHGPVNHLGMLRFLVNRPLFYDWRIKYGPRFEAQEHQFGYQKCLYLVQTCPLFNYKLELRQNGKVMSTYIDDTQSVLQRLGEHQPDFIDNTFGLNVYDQTCLNHLPPSRRSAHSTQHHFAAFDDTGNITFPVK